ncbi:B component of insecticidal toxin complex (Tc) [Xenorhabdus nematophila ATCC 19061]|uniref:B component of insecticidal toxin complex (Tc) n=1 Tax=Xenorhabdus nematophila (strain ATCC 19061 / DSM 3370 / CCUG 14189 / LMG 1036 / NCIMB 9965 / AN6) TaxID=406817 RepID=D3VGF8_XENNA|nr:SpvB/TcaC N-terminal domain-containing protein [Xenorhabdus nematophila]CBJ90394.1 B component of insecticidal toxin complex (Tc) [Xenorhabdus nematophila ATCC 19061]CEK23249.1 B component of insecticidal toxin complex (Tc) [Xenorhabdus nematophila AN6/1]
MTSTSSSDNLRLIPPTLPKGGGSLQGMPTTPGAMGPNGQAGFQLPFPVSAGRGYSPALSLSYQGGSGNGSFGVSWHCDVPAIRRRTHRGVPTYTDQDTFLGPDGEALVPEQDAQGNPITTSVNTWHDRKLPQIWQVTRYFPRVEGDFARIERWQVTGEADFWLVHHTNGEVLCLGKTAQARIADSAEPKVRIAAWLAEESVSPTGEHIYYQYINAADAGVRDPAGRDTHNQRTLQAVLYGNVTAQSDLFLWDGDAEPARQDWLFTLVLDYGARSMDSTVPPALTLPDKATWPVRQDAFSTYETGFEVRTHFLCRQVLMFHHFPTELGEAATLVNRLLITYDENPVLSRLVSVQTLAYEPDDTHTLKCLPPTTIDYTPFTLKTGAGNWHSMTLPDSLGLASYHLIDLYGEGLSGLLYQEGAGWYYRPPMRDLSPGAESDAVVFGDWEALPTIPSMQQGTNVSLLDINGDGRLEWLIIQPDGPAGYYILQANRTWSAFTPLTQLPLEYLHPDVTFADLHGGGLPDLAMIGPHSVRLYINECTGFDRGRMVMQDTDINLPMKGRDQQELVAFCDMLGSGQMHLVSVRHDRVLCWPNLGNGHFGAPLTLCDTLPFDAVRFNPRQIYLVDVDGSGTTDLVYADPAGIHLFLNQAGNTLSSPLCLPYPDGVAYDQLSQLSFADLSGQGTVSCVLTQYARGADLHPLSWRYDLSSRKPYLLTTMDNQCGARTILTHRSSAQEWLDEKQGSPDASPGIPFPLLVVSRVMQQDDLTGNTLVQTYRYRRGLWDGVEREFRGFGYVEEQDGEESASALAVCPLRICSWYHTGRQEDTQVLYGRPYVDSDAFTLGDTRLTRWTGDADDGHDAAFTPDTQTGWWLHRALKGTLLRREHYGLDGTPAAAVPYTVSQSRCQVRLVQAGDMPVVLPLSAGEITYHYERVASDPQVTQSIPLQYDSYGHGLWTINVNYPRRLTADSPNPYTATALPDSAWSATFDEQQTLLRLTENRIQMRNQPDAQAWVLGIPEITRQNMLTYPGSQSPKQGLTLEALSTSDGLLGSNQPRVLVGLIRHHYHSNASQPKNLILPAHTETALLRDEDLKAYDGVLTAEQRQKWLTEGGYHTMPALLSAPGVTDEPAVWAGNTGFMTYLGAPHFWRPHTQTPARLPGADGVSPVLTATWDSYDCCLLSSMDAYGNTTQADIDYRFLIPRRVTDINDNRHEVQLDALGRVVATSRYGTELGDNGTSSVNVGFSPLNTHPAPVQDTVEAAVAHALAVNQGKATQPQATRVVYDVLCRMGQLTTTHLKQVTASESDIAALHLRLQALRFITAQGHILSPGWQWVDSDKVTEGVPDALREVMKSVPRQPIHYAILAADAYPDNPQQVNVQVAYRDGFGRALQGTALVPAGSAYERTDDGELAFEDGHLVTVPAEPRWTVTGRVEYNLKGQTVRVYQPYFVNNWRAVADTALRAHGYADTHYYDATGREIRVVTAKGEVRRQGYTPWFIVAEDENDTASEIMAMRPMETDHE